MTFKQLKQAIKSAQKLHICSKNRIETFVLHVYLVVIGVRDGYLVDEFSTDEATIISLMESFLHIFGPSKSVVLISMATGDFIIGNADAIIRKSMPNWLDANHIVVDISTTEPILIKDVSSIELSTHNALCEIFGACNRLVVCNKPRIHTTSLELCDNFAVGYEFIAGFLLGYACIYNYPRDKMNKMGMTGNALSMHTLLKTSISVMFEGVSTAKREIVVQEFSTPESVYILDGVDMKRRNILTSTMTRICDMVSNSSSEIPITMPKLEEDYVTIASLTF